MGWTIWIQLVRGRALDRGELTRLRAHVRASGLVGEGYAFEVAPAGSSGVIARAGGKLARSLDPDEDPRAAKLMAALTELHGLFADARLELADDFHLVGWDGTAVTLVQDPDQELTEPPRDRAGWTMVPARRTPTARPPARAAPKLPPALAAALAAIAAGEAPDDLSATTPDEALVLLRVIGKAAAGKHPDHALRNSLDVVASHVPARTLVDLALAEVALLDTAASTTIARAMERLPDRAAVRERVLAVWQLPPPAKGPDRRWDAIGYALLMPLAHDPWLIARLGDEHDAADRDDPALWRRGYNRERILALSPDGVRRLIRRRRRDRVEHRRPLTSGLLSYLSGERFDVAVPTLLLELAVARDRDDLTLALARYREPRFLLILERMLATDQYARVVAEALHHFDGDDATAMLLRLIDHADPLVRIRASQGLVGRQGAPALPRLVAAVEAARTMGIWRHEYPPGGWCNAQLRSPADALAAPWTYRGRWPDVTAVVLGPAEASDPPAAEAIDRMLSPNPDIRRDAIELAHQRAIATRDARSALTLARAERLHRALCDAAGLPTVTGDGSTSRVRVSGFWSSPVWRKLLAIPFDPAYKYDWVTWDWLEAHAGERVAQDAAAELADVRDEASAKARAEAYGLRALAFARAEYEAWTAREAAIIDAIDAPGG